MSKMKDIYTISQELAQEFGLDPNNNLIVSAIAQSYLNGQWDYIQEKSNA